MKKLISLSCTLLLYVSLVNAQTNNVIYADVPREMSYAAYAYLSTGEPLNNQDISLRVNILKGSITGSVEYQEIHSTTTRDDGYFAIRIGEGTWTAGNHTNIREIDWGADEYFLKMEIDVTGGYNFGEAGTEAFCSVPYAFHASVADSIPGVDPDSLRMAATAVGVCPCTLQEAYDNASTIDINLNNTTSNSVKIINSNYAGTSLFNQVTNTGGVPGFFEISNVANTNKVLQLQTTGSGNALQLITSSNSNPNPTLNISQNGTGSVIQAFSANTGATNPPLFVSQKGIADGGLFTIAGANNTTAGIAALRAEIQTGLLTPNILTGAGIFHIAEPLNTAPVVFAETKGTGSAGVFHKYGVLAADPAVDIRTLSNNSSLGLKVISAGTGAGAVAEFDLSNPGNLNAYSTISASHSGTGYCMNLRKVFNALATPANYAALYVSNESYGPGIFVHNSAISNTDPAFASFNQGKGVTGFFGAAPAINSPPSDVVSILGYNGHLGRGLYVRLYTPTSTANALEVANSGIGTSIRAFTTSVLAANKYVAHFTTNNTSNNTATMFVESNAPAPAIYSVKTNSGPCGVFQSSSQGTKDYSLYGFNIGTGHGIFGWSNLQNGIEAYTSGPTGKALYAQSSPLYNFTSWAGYFVGRVNITGNFQVISGSKNAVIKNNSGDVITTYSEESSEVWFSDYGSGQLNNGTATVSIAADFIQTVSTNISYYVIIQPEGDSKGLYVTNKTSTSFDVNESQGGTSFIAFSYRIVAKRKNFENLRLASPEQNQQVSYANLQTMWPELITEANNKNDDAAGDINNNFDVNHVVTTPAPDAVPTPTVRASPALSPDANTQSLQQSNPYIQNVDTNPPPH